MYVTGSDDRWNVQHDGVSRDSMNAWCVFGTVTETELKGGHEAATPYSLRRAMTALDQRASADPAKLSSCRQRVAKEMAADLQRVADLIERDQLHDASRSLTKLDVRYGGLAASESIQLEQRVRRGLQGELRGGQKSSTPTQLAE